MNKKIKCPLCGFEFTPQEAKVVCSVKTCKQCSGYCCPNCNYKLPGESKIVNWLEGLFQRDKKTDKASNTN